MSENQHHAEGVQSALLTKEQAARYLNVTARWMSRDHGIPFVQLGGRKYYLPADLDAYIDAHRYGGRK